MCGNCPEEKKKVFEIKYNDFGTVLLIAETFEEAEKSFRIVHPVEDYTIKSITSLQIPFLESNNL